MGGVKRPALNRLPRWVVESLVPQADVSHGGVKWVGTGHFLLSVSGQPWAFPGPGNGLLDSIRLDEYYESYCEPAVFYNHAGADGPFKTTEPTWESIGCYVSRIGGLWAQTGYVALVLACYLDVTWWVPLGGEIGPIAATVGGELVAVVMPRAVSEEVVANLLGATAEAQGE